MTPYAPCSLTARYPILLRISPECRPSYVAKAEAGQPLSMDECICLGLAPCESFVLVPQGRGATRAQLDSVFGGDMTALREIMQPRQRRETAA